jgi:hypothetical protein
MKNKTNPGYIHPGLPKNFTPRDIGGETEQSIRVSENFHFFWGRE